MNKRQVRLVELLVLFNWFTVILFAFLISVLDLSDLSQFALRLTLFTNIPIAICYGMFVVKHQPPLGQKLLKLLAPSSNAFKHTVEPFSTVK